MAGRRVLLIGFVLAGSLSGVTCIGALGLNLFPDSKDIELGLEVDGVIKNSPEEYPLLQGRPDVQRFVESVGRKILSSPQIEKRSVYAYEFNVIHDDSTINAFCTPGGYIYVYTGLLKFLENEAALAGILGHEIAHAERRHATRRMSSLLGVQVMLSIALGEDPPQLAEIAGNLFAGLGLLVNSRSDETEADEYSIRYLRSTEYYPGGILYFFEKVSEAGKQAGTLDRLLSTHPLPEDRKEHARARLAEIGNPAAAETNIFSERYRKFKESLP